MKRLLVYILLIIGTFLIQTGVVPYFTLGGIAPNLFIITTASIGTLRGRKEGCLFGFFSGILLESLYTTYFGIYALIFSTVGYFTGYIKKYFYEEDMTMPILFIGLSDLFYGLVIYLTSFLARGRINFFYYFRKIILPETIYSLIIAVFIYRLIIWINKQIETKGSENRID